MSLINIILLIALCLSIICNIVFFYYWRKEYLRNEPLTAKVYDFFRWVAVILIFLIPVSEAFLKKAGIEIVLISDNTMQIFKQTLIFFVLPHMLYSIKDFIPEATEFLRALKNESATSHVGFSYPNAPNYPNINNKGLDTTVGETHVSPVVPDPNQYH